MKLQAPGPRSPLPPHAQLRFDLIRRILKETKAEGSFLEIGCGQGGFAEILAQHFDYVGYEPDPQSYETVRTRLEKLRSGKVVNGYLPDTPDRTFDLIGAFEVLEHLADDRASMEAWTDWLRPNGYVLVSVPAHPDRFGPWDEKVGHFRRYSRAAITRVLTDAGIVDVRTMAYGFPLGYASEWVRDRIAAKSGPVTEDADMAARTAASGRSLQPSRFLAPAVWAGTLPFRIIQRPFVSSERGTGWVSFGRRPA